MGRIISTIWLAVLTALVAVPAALAQDGTGSAGYPGGGVAGDVENRLSGGGGGVAAAGGTLPFTGVNLLIVVIGGVVLVGLGALLLVRGRTGANTPV